MTEIRCLDCGQPYPETGVSHRCPRCGGLFDASLWNFDLSRIDSSQPGLWRYRDTFGLPENVPPLTLGEGNTPLLWAEVFGRQVAFKCEFANPTGSFKDRGMATLVAALKARGVTEAVEDSSGNAGAAFAAYAARANIKARVFVPESASGPKRIQIEMYGAELVPVPGPRSAATATALKAVEQGAVYASHAYLPFNLPGYATAAYEIWEQVGSEVGAVIVPAGQGGFLLGMARGFQALVNANLLKRMPVLIGVQAAACAPLVAFAEGRSMEIGEEPTLAEGVRIRDALRKVEVVKVVLDSGGRFVSAEEADILPGRDELAHRGFYVEPTSAIVWSALRAELVNLPDPVVVVLTGSGYKFRT
ncbi:MAG TPA: pyridoxal-phosphate dependent enzyme [Anaerolineales bacterium]|nr:pyridoxal-phosphate dependent enzyme [Anaerolineales bacterium]